jgi:hypothetical protein
LNEFGTYYPFGRPARIAGAGRRLTSKVTPPYFAC